MAVFLFSTQIISQLHAKLSDLLRKAADSLLKYPIYGGILMQYHFKLLSSYEEIELINAEWQKLTQETPIENPIFQSAFWCMAWLEINNGSNPQIATLWGDHKLVAILPLVADGKTLELLSAPDSEYGHILVSKELTTKEAFEQILSDLEKDTDFDLVKLINVPADDPICELTKDKNCKPSGLEYSSIVDLAGFDTYEEFLKNLSKSKRTKFRYKVKRLRKDWDVEFQLKRTTQEYLQEHLDLLLEWKTTWLNERGIVGSYFDATTMKDHILQMVKNSDEHSCLMTADMKLNGKFVACDMMLYQNNNLYSLLTARDLSYEKDGVGTAMNILTLEHAFTKGVSKIDYLPAPNFLKNFMSNKQVPVNDLLFPLSSRGNRLAALDRLNIRNHLKKRFYALPLGVRKKIISLKN